MANPTTNFGWVMPTSASLVTNLPADFNTFGQAVDTSMAQLKGGTTGQILSKTSATDMAFTWITNDVGDITAVTAGTGISGGGTSGAVTVTNSMATAITTAGDLIKGTGSGTFDRLGIGSTGQVLTVTAGAPAWATPSSGTPAFVGVSVYDSVGAGQSISNTTYTALTYDSENYDTDSFHSTSTNTSRLTIPTGKGGKYQINTFVNWDSTSGGRRIVTIYKNGTNTRVLGNQTSSGYLGQTGAYVIELAAADYIQVFVYQDSGGTRNCDEQKYFQATYLGA
jgi:hypothetical protein